VCVTYVRATRVISKWEWWYQAVGRAMVEQMGAWCTNEIKF